MDNKRDKQKFSGSKIRKSLIVILFLLAVALFWLGSLFRDELGSMNSIKELARLDKSRGQYLYQVEIQGNYYMDKFLERGGVTSPEDLAAFLASQMSKGFYTPQVEKQSPGACSSFTGELANGDRYFARNYDMEETAPLGIFHAKPDDGRYASISTVDLGHVGISNKGIAGISDKLLATAGVYVPMDGMNEKGLALSIHMSHQGPGNEVIPTDLNRGGLGVTSTSMMRLILDKAASVEEAVNMAKEVDLHDDIGSSFHFFITDASGASAVLQWVKGTDASDTDGTARDLVVIYGDDKAPFVKSEQYRILTNFITLEDYYEEGDIRHGLGRMNFLETQLAQTDGKLADGEAALDLLAQVAWSKMEEEEGSTVFSVVYNLTKKTAILVPYEAYDKETMKFTYKIQD